MTPGEHTLVVAAPAKVNLFLHVTGRRADGYHTLESLFTLIDLADTLVLRRRDDGAICRRDEVRGVHVDDDLCLRAARALQAHSGTRYGVEFELHKRIPIGGGLGGGSSDAASTLLALNRLWALELSRAELSGIAAALGADVPFFIGGQAAIARGIGEVLTPVSMPGLWIALACPQASIATAGIFAAAELTRNTASAKIDVFSEGYGRNDLQPVTVARAPEVGAAIQALHAAAAHARMTGSGACAIALCVSEADARRAVATLPRDIAGFVVRTIARHPLAAFA